MVFKCRLAVQTNVPTVGVMVSPDFGPFVVVGEADTMDTEGFKVTEQMQALLIAGGSFKACRTCLEARQSEGSELCPMSTMSDLHELVAECDTHTLHCPTGANHNHPPIVSDARTRPASMAVQKSKPKRGARANGTKKGNPSGTRINVSRANRDTAGMSRC